jgi:hypothetical protein
MIQVKEPYYDVLERVGTEYKSEFFDFRQFCGILKKSFMSWDEYRHKVENTFTDKATRELYIKSIGKYHDLKVFAKPVAGLLKDIILNDNRLAYTNFFRYKVLNFDSNKKIRFDFYVNGVSNLFLQPLEENAVITHSNIGIPEGMLICRVYNYSSKRGIPEPEHVDINMCISEEGIYDSQDRVFPFYCDEYVSNYELNLKGTDQYVISPFLQQCLREYDKILFLSKQRDSYVYAVFLKNAIDASYNDARIVVGMNDKYRRLQQHYIRVIPTLKKEIDGHVSYTDRFFPFLEQQYSMNIYSYADVISGGSGDSGSNMIRIKDYQDALDNLGITDIIFTKEENTQYGLFCWIHPGFAKVVEKYMNRQNLEYKVQTVDVNNPLNNHMFMIDEKEQQYITAVSGAAPEIPLSAKKFVAWVKKVNQRFKLSNGRTYKFETEDLHDDSIIKKKLTDSGLSFNRALDYLPTDHTIKEIDHARNALVAFVSSDIELPPVSKIVDMSVEDMNKWMYSLRGVACEGFFTKQFLSQRMVLKRTERLKCSLNECTPDFQEIVKDPTPYIGNMVPNNFRENFVFRRYMDCECTGKIINGECRSCNNPRPISSIMHDEFWVNFSKGFDFVVMRDIKVVEDGINVYLDYSIPLANARLKDDELMKSVAVETSQRDIGYVLDFECGEFSIKDANIPLDGIFYGLGGFKSGVNGIPFTVLRLYHALMNQVVYSSFDCVNKTDEVNEFLKTFKKSRVKTKMYNAATGKYENKIVDAWIGMISVSPTEASQEFNKARFEDERSFSKINYSLYGTLGFHDLNIALSRESALTNNQSSKLMDQLFKIAYVHASVYPVRQETTKQKELAVKHEKLLASTGVKNLSGDYLRDPNLFSIAAFDKYSLKSYITYDQYQYVLQKYPLFADSRFTDGFYLHCSLGLTKDQSALYPGIGEVEQTIYFPPKSVLLSMFEMVGENNVRINGLLGAYLSVFESLAVSKYGNAGGQYASNIQLVNKSNGKIFRSFNDMNGRILRQTKMMLFGKEGLLNQSTNIAVPRIMSKQLTSINCPYDVAIVGKNSDYKRIVKKILDHVYPNREQDWTTPELNTETNKYSEPGWCWLEDVYGFSIREPNLFSKQNLNIKQIWSSYKADIEYNKLYGVSFHAMHPGTKGIYLNPVFVAFNLEGDVDGDNIYLGMPYTKESQTELLKVYNRIKDNAFFDKNNPDEIANYVRASYLVPSLIYLLDEAKNLNFNLDTLKIGYSTIKFSDSLSCNFAASENKTDVGPLTTSLWTVNDFLSFYQHNYQRLVDKGYVVPELTRKNQYELMFIFEYLLAQQNGVRAMKDDGSYSKLTLDSLVVDKQFQENEPTARALFIQLIKDYKSENEKHNIKVDFSDTVDKFIKILDNLFVSTGTFKGFGFMTTYDGRKFKFSDRRWTYGEKKGDQYYDCTDRFDPFFVDFYASYLLLFGRDPSVFIDKFGYQRTLQALEFKNKPHMHTDFLSFVKDTFVK